MNQLRSFTGLRGLACIVVVLDHCTTLGLGGARSLEHSGGMAVLFFFLLSGYLLMKRGLLEIRPTREAVPNRFLNMKLIYYLVRRIFRMYPAFFVALVGYYCMSSYMIAYNIELLSHAEEWRVQVWNTLVLRDSETHMWTIKIELIFYVIMLPVILVLSAECIIVDYKYFRQYRLFSLTILFYVFVMYKVIKLPMDDTGSFWSKKHKFMTHLPAFWYGCVGGIISHYIQIYNIHLGFFNSRTGTNIVKRGIIEIITYMIMIRIFFGNEEIARLYLDLQPYHFWYQSPIALTPFYALILLVLELTEGNNSFGNMMGSTFFYSIGEISYSVYLIHWGIIEMYTLKTKIKGFDGTCACSLLIFINGIIFYNIIEKRGVMLGNKLIIKIKSFRVREGRKEFQKLQDKDHIRVAG